MMRTPADEGAYYSELHAAKEQAASELGVSGSGNGTVQAGGSELVFDDGAPLGRGVVGVGQPPGKVGDLQTQAGRMG
eukprot:4239470-Pyramimonas_sp.AAC.1